MGCDRVAASGRPSASAVARKPAACCTSCATDARLRPVHTSNASSGHRLDAATRATMESRFGRDFGQVRAHSDARAATAARDAGADAYTIGHDIVFGAGRYRPTTVDGRRLLGHELAHVVQQTGAAVDGESAPANAATSEREADAAGDAVVAGRPAVVATSAAPSVQRRAAPYIRKVTVHLDPSESAELEWEGTPPADAPGSDAFTVSTGKGYSDPDDPAGTCKRTCCADAEKQCAPPWNRPDKVGACCTYTGTNFWTGVSLDEHNGWKWWTPIQPWYGSRGIALHQHSEVTGQPIGHGCVRMDEANAKRIHDYSNGRKTNVTIDGRASPVLCDEDRRCESTKGRDDGKQGRADPAGEEPTSVAEAAVVPGLEGEMS